MIRIRDQCVAATIPARSQNSTPYPTNYQTMHSREDVGSSQEQEQDKKRKCAAIAAVGHDDRCLRSQRCTVNLLAKPIMSARSMRFRMKTIATVFWMIMIFVASAEAQTMVIGPNNRETAFGTDPVIRVNSLFRTQVTLKEGQTVPDGTALEAARRDSWHLETMGTDADPISAAQFDFKW